MVSVIIPNYNHESYLKQRIDSVLNQTYQNFEVILLDDCSVDGSRSVLETYRSHPKVKCILYNEENGGSTFKQWGSGLALAKGEWVWIAESDDFCDTNFLEELLKQDLNGCDIRYGISIPVDEQGKKIDTLTYPYVAERRYEGHVFINSFLLKGNYFLNASSVLIRTHLLQEALDSETGEFKLFGDWLVWIKACARSEVAFVTTSTNYHRCHNNTVREQSKYNGVYLKEFRKFRRVIRQVIDESTLLNKSELLKNNEILLAHELGMAGCDLIKQRKVVKSVPLILEATWKLNFNSYYIRSACYWLLKNRR